MIAPNDNTTKKRILALGLQAGEAELVNQIADNLGVIADIAQNDLDLWDHAQSCHYDLYILGQSEEIPNPTYLIWLLKGVAVRCKFILIYSTPPENVEHRDEIYKISNRPVVGKQLLDAVWSALKETHIGENRFGSILSRLNPRTWFKK